MPLASHDSLLPIALAAAVAAVVLRLSRARGPLEWTAVALFCATVVWGLVERLGCFRIGPGPALAARRGTWPARIGGDVLLVTGLLALARAAARRVAAGAESARRASAAQLGRALELPLVLLGYVVREPTLLGIAGWAVTSAAWLARSVFLAPGE